MNASESRGVAARGQNSTRNTRLIVLAAATGVILVVFVLVAAISLAGAGQERDLAAHQQTGETAEALIHAKDAAQLESAKFTRTKASHDVPNLVSLLGLPRDEALAAMGNGATVRAEEPDSTGAYALVATVALADERSKDGPGAPTVRLWLDGHGVVRAAVYSASLRSFGFSNALTFRQVVADAHAIQEALADAGVSCDDAPSLPDDPQAYSTYRADGNTLEHEHAEFAGKGKTLAAGKPIAWKAALDYDYSEAIQTGNLVYTHRVLSVGAGPLL